MKTKKKQVILDVTEEIYDSCDKTDEVDLLGRSTFTLLILIFCEFLRYSEISNIRKSDTMFENSHMKIFIEENEN